MLATGEKAVTIGKPTAVCLVVSPLVWEVGGEIIFYSQVLITPEADDFSRFSVAECEFEIRRCFSGHADDEFPDSNKVVPEICITQSVSKRGSGSA